MATWSDITDIVDVEMVLAGPPGTGITEAEKTEYDTRIAAVETMPLDGLSDVTTAGAVDNQALIYDSTQTPPWRPGGVSGSLAEIHNNLELVGEDISRLHFLGPFTVTVFTDPSGETADVQVQFGTQPGTIAEGHHLHPLPVSQRFTLADPASLPNISSGARDLVTANIGPFAVDVPTLVEVRGHVYGEGLDLGGSLVDIYIWIDGVEDSSGDLPNTAPFTWEQGVNAAYPWESSRVITRLTEQAQSRQVVLGVRWRGGAALDVKSAWMTVTRTAYR